MNSNKGNTDCMSNNRIPTMISELSWINQSDMPSTCMSSPTKSFSSSSSSATSSSTSSTAFGGEYPQHRSSHHLHLLIGFPHKYLGKVEKTPTRLQQTTETEIKPTKHKDDLRIKLESELYQKVRQAVKTPPRERMIRRRLNEFEQQVRRRLENEKEKKQLVTHLNDVITLGGLTNPIDCINSSINDNNSSKNSDIKLNSIDETGYMDVRMHPESYQQNIGWYRKFDMNEVNSDNGNGNNIQRILWNKKNSLTEKGLKKIRFLLCNHDTGGENETSVNCDDVLKRQLNKTIGFRDTYDRSHSPLYLNSSPESMNGFFRRNHSTTVQVVHNSSHTNTTTTYNNNTTNSIDTLSTSLSSNNTAYYSNYLSNKFQNFKNNLIHIRRPLNNNSSVNRVCLNSQENNDYNPLFNDSFTFSWNTLCIEEYKNVQNTNTTTDKTTNNNDLQDSVTSSINRYHPMTLGYLTEEDIQLIQRYYKLYQSKLLSLAKKNTRMKSCHFTTRQSILQQLGRLTDGEKQLFYFSATRAAYLMASTQCEHKLPDGTQFRLINQKDAKPLDHIVISNSFVEDASMSGTQKDEVICQPELVESEKVSVVSVQDNNGSQNENVSAYTLPTFVDWSAVIRDRHGPFWPQGYGPVCQILNDLHAEEVGADNYKDASGNSSRSNKSIKPFIPDHTEEINQLRSKQTIFNGIRVIYDSECSPCLSKSTDTTSSPSGNLCQLVKDLQDTDQWSPPSLIFESRFESGNLRQVRQIGPFHYELLLKPDLYTKRHVQWYFFSVQNALPGFTYSFLIVNFTKPTSLYSQGLQPLLYSKINTQQNATKWIRVGRNIKYSRNTKNLSNHLLDTNGEYYQLEWDMEFPYADDVCYLAYSYPYTYTNLKYDLNEILLKAREDPVLNKSIKCEVACQTRAGNSCFLITVTDPNIPNKQKYAVVITARVHPGETNSSWMVLGFLRFLMSNEGISMELKKQYIFYIVPMLNPDGVIVGNYRCSLTGRDLNRNYRQPRKDIFPTVWTVKQLVKWCKKKYKDVIYCDMHGHSRRNNIFMYGCDASSRYSKIFNNNTGKSLHERLLPYIISQEASSYFSFPNCRFTIHPSKEATSRVVFWREFEVINSFTMEATFNASTLENNSLMKLNVADFLKMGEKFGYSLYKFHEVITNPVKLQKTLRNLAKETLTNLCKTRIPYPVSDNTTTKVYKDNESIYSQVSRDFLSPDLKIYDFIRSQQVCCTPAVQPTTTTTTMTPTTATSEAYTSNTHQIDNLLRECLLNSSSENMPNDTRGGDDCRIDDEQMNSFENLAKIIYLLENSNQLINTKSNENNNNDNNNHSKIRNEDASSTSDSNSDSEPEMTITAQNSLNQKFNFRGDFVLTNQEKESRMNQGDEELQSGNINQTSKMHKWHKKKKRRRNTRQHYHLHDLHHQRHPRRTQPHLEQQQQHTKKTTSSNDCQTVNLTTTSSSSSSTTMSASSAEQTECCRRQLRDGMRRINPQTDDKEVQNIDGKLYFVSKYAGQSNRGIPCFVEKRLFHRSCQRIRSVWENINFKDPQTLRMQRLETKIHNLKNDEPLKNTEILRYLKQIHFDAQRKLKFIQCYLLQTTDRSYYNKLSTNNKNETFILPPPPPVPAAAPPPPPLPRPLPGFTNGCRPMKTTGNETKMVHPAAAAVVVAVDDIHPRSKSCNIFARSTHHNHNNKSVELPRIVDKTRQEKKTTNGIPMSKSVENTKKQQPVDKQIRSEESHES
ncbi:unnamed protein product [Trichobilharzia szidati]|nr:unnamed protein product [Trichobilharzia szidati]